MKLTVIYSIWTENPISNIEKLRVQSLTTDTSFVSVFYLNQKTQND